MKRVTIADSIVVGATDTFVSVWFADDTAMSVDIQRTQDNTHPELVVIRMVDALIAEAYEE